MYYIYRITNLINQKTYIGQHQYTDIDDGYMGSGKILQKAYKKYGFQNFKKEILKNDIETFQEANKWEIHFIGLERQNGKAEYNITAGGEGFRARHREESKRKIAIANLGNKKGFQKNTPSWNKGKHYKIKNTSNMSHPSWNKGMVGYREGIPKTESQKEKMRFTAQKASQEYREYKKNGGELVWNEWRKTNKR